MKAFLLAILVTLTASVGLTQTPPAEAWAYPGSFTKSDFVAIAAKTERPQVGMFYFLWHCPVSESQKHNVLHPVFDASKAILGTQEWAGIPSFHWWSKPADGYYCLTENEALLKKHAELLGDAGIDFIYVDASNWTDRHKDLTEQMIVEPFDKLMEVWSKIPGAPKVVPFVPINGKGTLVEYFDAMLDKYPHMAFKFKGKSLLLAVRTLSNASSPQYVKLSHKYSLRSMWGLLGRSDLRAGHWSFIQPCEKGFLAKKGDQECNQGESIVSGQLEQVSVSAAYQDSYMSNYETAVPKFFGKTLLRQMESAHKSKAPIVTITGWNEWIAQRFCPDGGVNCTAENDHFPNGNKVFVDQYSYEYSRDLEPSAGEGMYYYNLMKAAVAKLKAGQNPMQLIGMVRPQDILGIIDGVGKNPDGSYAVLGWACTAGLNDSIRVALYAGGPGKVGAYLSGAVANLSSEDAVAKSCGAQGNAYRFSIPITVEQAKAHAGKKLFVHGASPVAREHSLLTRSGELTLPK